ncbi:MAG: SpoIIE family protein phosphatase [Betaproteobacteria bacterium]
MRILVADDSPLERKLLAAFLLRRGHTVVEVEDGRQAVAANARQHFDLVFMDSIMPNMVGNEAVRLIRKQDTDTGHFTPVLFVSGLEDTTEMVASLAFGADDYLTKPINWDLLEAKLSVFARISAQHEALEHYRSDSEADKAFGRQVLEHLTRVDRISELGVRHYNRPLDQLSGDLFAAVRSPGGATYALLADAMGHGLPPALSQVLLAEVFYGTAERDLALSSIVTVANAKLKALLPSGFFIAAAFARIDLSSRRLQVWNGGIPMVQVMGGQQVVRRFPSTNPALGVLGTDAFDATIVEHDLGPSGELLMATDGVTEVLGEAAMQLVGLGFDVLVERLAAVTAQDDMIVAELKLH